MVIVHSPKTGIPLFGLTINEEGRRVIEVLNKHSGETETFIDSAYVAFLVNNLMVQSITECRCKELRTPKKRILLGNLIRNDNGKTYCIHVKDHKKEEDIQLITYIYLVLGSPSDVHVLKAS